MNENLKEKELGSVTYTKKPITIVYEDFKKNLADVINNSGLPPFIIEAVLQNYLIEASNVAKKQYLIDKTQYEKSLLEHEENQC